MGGGFARAHSWGWVSGLSEQVFVHAAQVERDTIIVVHGDDFVVKGSEDQLSWVESMLKEK